MAKVAKSATEVDKLLKFIKDSGVEIVDLRFTDIPGQWLIVSNEVGQGVVPAYAAGRLFRDLLGWANQRLADKADEVIWMVAGIPIPIGQYRLKE